MGPETTIHVNQSNPSSSVGAGLCPRPFLPTRTHDIEFIIVCRGGALSPPVFTDANLDLVGDETGWDNTRAG
jgi:hypothetical protein